MKKITVVNGQNMIPCEVLPGTTTADILSHVGVPCDNWLSTRDGVPFATDELVYDKLNDGEKLITSSKANVS